MSKALCAYKPDISGIEGVLMEDELCVIVKHLRDISESSSKSEDHSYYSAREILLITKGITRIPANCTGLVEKGIEEVLICLMDKNDEKIRKIVGSISWQIATVTAYSGSTAMDSALTAIGKSMHEHMSRQRWRRSTCMQVPCTPGCHQNEALSCKTLSAVA